jgi:2'-5' RNA ligase
MDFFDIVGNRKARSSTTRRKEGRHHSREESGYRGRGMSDTAMIAFLPTNGSWCKQDFPHMTLVYAGDITDRPESEFNEMAKDAISAARVVRSFSLSVVGVEQLGDAGEEVDALMLFPTPQLLVAYNMVSTRWDKSEFKGNYLPHATIGPAGSARAETALDNTDEYSYKNRQRYVLPSSIYFDRLAVCWGDDKMIFSLSDYDY